MLAVTALYAVVNFIVQTLNEIPRTRKHSQLAGMKSVAGIIGPTFLALMLTVAVHPVHNWLRRKGCPSWVGVAAALVVVYGILVGLTGRSRCPSPNSRRLLGPPDTSVGLCAVVRRRRGGCR